MNSITLNYPLFDGKKIMENASVTIKNGIIIAISEAESTNKNCLLMPGLIDAHTHMTSDGQIQAMLKNGVVATCDVCAPASLIENSKPFTIVSSAGMTMGTLNGKSYVTKAIENGAKYIKVLLFEPNLMPKITLKSICRNAHEHNLKVAVHATSVKAERTAMECGADILLHVPMKEEMPEELAEEIAERGIAVAPTLVMMKAFAHSGKNGYMPEHYANAQKAVQALHCRGATLMAATDANAGNFAPPISYGDSLHREMKLLCDAGLSPVEALTSATATPAEKFGIEGHGTAKVGKAANLLLIDGRPDKDIGAMSRVAKVFINGEQLA